MTENFTGSITPYYFFVKGEVAGIENDEGSEELFLSVVNPNPFVNSTIISFILPAGKDAGEVSLDIFDVSGRLVKTLIETPYIPGLYTVSWDGKDNAGKDVASGIYFFHVTIPGKLNSIQKAVLIK